jgi:hypothetical protein
MNIFSLMTGGRQDAGSGNPNGNGIGGRGVTSVIVLLLLIGGAALIGYLDWTMSNSDVPTSGYVAMAFGVIFSLVFGIGLMALLFYSSRKGYDEPPVLILESRVESEEVPKASHEDKT